MNSGTPDHSASTNDNHAPNPDDTLRSSHFRRVDRLLWMPAKSVVVGIEYLEQSVQKLHTSLSASARQLDENFTMARRLSASADELMAAVNTFRLPQGGAAAPGPTPGFVPTERCSSAKSAKHGQVHMEADRAESINDRLGRVL
ncbi:hypothetical protein HOP51_01140 [Halomonas sp. MCCC 1A11036]|uniref:Uncharacterized protein n=1 Tax=Billgrantia zhangzhouensis TaxID=2733481 RepID=A0ABS9A9W7_9GAMM|nr:hypothetical protein [Halomonas zhangzhouensis]MCE8018725.1 hypothetical protein [Halomonas zhangzhouensis]